MAVFVIDAFATLPWCFEDVATSWTGGLLERLRGGDQIQVPAHWPTEISNGMLLALRRKRIQPGRPELFWDELSILPIEVEPALSPLHAKTVLSLCEKYGMTVYDAAYLELAKRKGLPLATLDKELIAASPQEGVSLVEQQP